MMMLENDLPDFEPQPMNPMQQLQEIVELIAQCIHAKKAYASISFGGCKTSICLMLTTRFNVNEYGSPDNFLIVPPDDEFQNIKPMYAELEDQKSMNAIINRLKEVLL